MSSIEAIRERLEQMFADVSETLPRTGTLSSEILGRPDRDVPKGWIWELDLDGNYTWSSPEIEKVLGISANDVLGKPFAEIGFDQESRQLIIGYFDKNLPIEHLILNAENQRGQTLSLFVRALQKTDSDGNPSGYRGVGQLIEEASQPLERLDIPLPEKPDVTEAYTSVPEIAPTWGEVLGYQADETGVTRIDTTHDPLEKDEPKSDESILVPLQVQDEIIGTIELERKDTKAWSEDEKELVEAVAHEFALALQDARSYQLTQQALEEMREADRLKSQFLANMSHELRTPLNSIIGFSKVILKGIDGPITEKQDEDLTAIYNAGQHLLGLINDILDLSRIEAGKMELAFTEVDLGEIIRGVMSTAVGLVKEKPIELILDIPEDLPLLQADNIRIRQVLLNLVSNAAKFTEEGHIGISARTIKRGNQTDIVIAVFDTGPGIHPADQEKIFEPFSQVDASPTRKTGGTGLGLSICRHLVELHGGIIWVESVPSEGSTFAFTLPYTPPENPQVIKQPLILGVDTEIEVLKLYRDALERNSFRFHNLTRPDHAIEVTRALNPDLLLFDMFNAAHEDWRLLSQIRNEPSLDATQILVASLDPQNDSGSSPVMQNLLAFPLRETAIETTLHECFNTDIQNARLLVVVNEDQLASVRAFFENLGGMEVRVASELENAIEGMQDAFYDGYILSLSLPLHTFEGVLQSIRNEMDHDGIPPVIGLLPENDNPRVLKDVSELALKLYEHNQVDLEQCLDNLIDHLRKLDL
jgi:signal transduction histidine kinase/DNA-binding response OmpR family regulator